MKPLATVLALLILPLLFAASPGAQVQPSVPQQPKIVPATPETTPSPGGTTAGDAVLAAWLMIASNNEVALAGTAQQRAASSEVKQFAQRMVGDHGRFAQSLQAFAGATATDRGARQQQPADASGLRQAAPLGAFDHMALIRDLGKKCLEAETNLLNEKTGADFDRCYMRMQVLGHVKAAAMIEAFAGHASDQLRPTLEEGHKTMLGHLEDAKSLCKQLEDAAHAQKAPKAEKVSGGK
jgi:predicted outer membrane protein